MEFKVYQKELELQSRGWIPTFHDVSREVVEIVKEYHENNYPLEAKRDLVKNSVKVHKKMGTKYAIETALGSLFPESEVEEWIQLTIENSRKHVA